MIIKIRHSKTWIQLKPFLKRIWNFIYIVRRKWKFKINELRINFKELEKEQGKKNPKNLEYRR